MPKQRSQTPEGLRAISVEAFNSANASGKHWILIDGFVVDVTEFEQEHPGGGEILGSPAFGHSKDKDATRVFYQEGGLGNPGHTRAAIKIMKKLRIGTLDPESEGLGGNRLVL